MLAVMGNPDLFCSREQTSGLKASAAEEDPHGYRPGALCRTLTYRIGQRCSGLAPLSAVEGIQTLYAELGWNRGNHCPPLEFSGAGFFEFERKLKGADTI